MWSTGVTGEKTGRRVQKHCVPHMVVPNRVTWNVFSSIRVKKVRATGVSTSHPLPPAKSPSPHLPCHTPPLLNRFPPGLLQSAHSSLLTEPACLSLHSTQHHPPSPAHPLSSTPVRPTHSENPAQPLPSPPCPVPLNLPHPALTCPTLPRLSQLIRPTPC